jgi:tetratricopeptide (TPR) repeat protein
MAALRPLMPWTMSLLLVPVLGQGQAPQGCAPPANTKQVEARLDKARQDRIAGKTDAAAAAVEAILTQNPDHFRALYTKALILADQRKFADAETLLEKAIAIQQKCVSTPQFESDYTVYNTLGWVQLARGDQRKAEDSFKAALAHAKELTASSLARTKSNLGYLYFSNGEFDKAQPLLEEAADAGNSNAVNTLTALDQARKIYKSSAVQAK